ncbi:hypothetical protein FKV24_012655 [Lysobacter maris]|uniref:Uncharacterized protein n=1 Tax=Marilutibacter maris TaxID=1605891 RepID=A0A508AGJ1_9GAMM|nr:hypothetical protein [Lysobacter maris]KAB8180180.1 hypothetical protein FKV24_012655 [Lysobacter maris]
MNTITPEMADVADAILARARESTAARTAHLSNTVAAFNAAGAVVCAELDQLHATADALGIDIPSI